MFMETSTDSIGILNPLHATTTTTRRWRRYRCRRCRRCRFGLSVPRRSVAGLDWGRGGDEETLQLFGLYAVAADAAAGVRHPPGAADGLLCVRVSVPFDNIDPDRNNSLSTAHSGAPCVCVSVWPHTGWHASSHLQTQHTHSTCTLFRTHGNGGDVVATRKYKKTRASQS